MTREQAIERFNQEMRTEGRFVEVTHVTSKHSHWSVYAKTKEGRVIYRNYDKTSVYLLMWQEAMSQIGEDYPGEETKGDGRVTVYFNDFWMHFYDSKEITYCQDFNELNLFKLYKIWNEHEKIF